MSQTHRTTCLVVAVVASLLFAWAVVLLGFHLSGLSSEARTSNAIALIVIWAFGPALWFLLEWRIWRAEPGLATGQAYARDFWIGAGAIVLLLAAREMGSSTPAPAREYVVAWNLVVEVIRIIAWPALAAAALVLFREPLGAFLQALGSRASKIGVFSVSLELSALPEARPWSGPRLDDLRAESPTIAVDSSGSLFRAIADTSNADYVTVNLEDGQAWLTSRLFILAALIPRVRAIKRIVFLSGSADHFVGHASPAAIVEAFARIYPWLAQAYVGAHGTTAPLLTPLDSQAGRSVLSQYLQNVRGTGTTADFVKLTLFTEHAAWITSVLLERDLGRALEIGALKRDPAADAVSLAKVLLRHESTYVAVLDSSGRFSQLIDRMRALDQVVRQELR